MTTMTGTLPHYRCNDVVLTLGVGGSHHDMVDELRKTAWRRYLEEHRNRMGGWLRSFS